MPRSSSRSDPPRRSLRRGHLVARQIASDSPLPASRHVPASIWWCRSAACRICDPSAHAHERRFLRIDEREARAESPALLEPSSIAGSRPWSARTNSRTATPDGCARLGLGGASARASTRPNCPAPITSTSSRASAGLRRLSRLLTGGARSDRRRPEVPHASHLRSVKCRPGKAYAVASALVETVEEFSEVYSTSGQYDLIAKFYLEAGATSATSSPSACRCSTGCRIRSRRSPSRRSGAPDRWHASPCRPRRAGLLAGRGPPGPRGGGRLRASPTRRDRSRPRRARPIEGDGEQTLYAIAADESLPSEPRRVRSVEIAGRSGRPAGRGGRYRPS